MGCMDENSCSGCFLEAIIQCCKRKCESRKRTEQDSERSYPAEIHRRRQCVCKVASKFSVPADGFELIRDALVTQMKTAVASDLSGRDDIIQCIEYIAEGFVRLSYAAPDSETRSLAKP